VFYAVSKRYGKLDFINKIHPVIVHFPIALFAVYTVLEIIALFIKNESYSKIVLLILGIGVLFSLLAVLTGNRAAEISKSLVSPGAAEIIETHESFATITMFYYSAILFVKSYLIIKKKSSRLIKYSFLVLVLIGNIFIYLTGYYGGELVFKYGIGTQLMKNPQEADK
jgi:uncharacterized membrane protein